MTTASMIERLAEAAELRVYFEERSQSMN